MWTGAELKKRVEQLTNYWEAVNNAAMGRGVTPIVSPRLANVVADAFAEWVDFREGLGGLEFSPALEDDLRKWREAADTMAEAIRAEGQPAPKLDKWDPTFTEQAENAASSAAKAAVGTVVVISLAVSLPIGLALLYKRGSR